MDAVNNGSLASHPLAAQPDRAKIDPMWLLGAILYVLGALAAIAAVIVAVAMGETTVAIVVGIVAGAFFTRVAC